MKVRYSIALDDSGNKINIDTATNGKSYFCPICGKKMVAKTEGKIRGHHFAHKEKCTETWSYDMSEWHKKWQSFFSGKTEIILKNGEKTHIADVIVGNNVIEFQHSPISLEEFRDRNHFYSELGYKVIWLFDLTDLYKIERIKKSFDNDIEYCWNYVKVPFKNMDLINEQAEIYIQLEEITNLNEVVIHNIFQERENFKVFYSDKYQSMSVNDFIKYVNTGKAMWYKDIISKKVADENYYPFPLYKEKNIDKNNFQSVGTIPELWKDDYKTMIIENTKTKAIFKVFNGQYKKGMLCFKNYNGYYQDSGRSVNIWGYSEPVWKILRVFSHSKEETIRRLSEFAFNDWYTRNKRIKWENPKLHGHFTLEEPKTLDIIMSESFDYDFVAKEVSSGLHFLFRSNWTEARGPYSNLRYYNAYVYLISDNAFLADYPVNYYIRNNLSNSNWQKLIFDSEIERKRKEELDRAPVYERFDMSEPIEFRGEYTIQEITQMNSKDFIAKNLDTNQIYIFKRVGNSGWNTMEFNIKTKEYNVKDTKNYLVWGTLKNSKWALNSNEIQSKVPEIKTDNKLPFDKTNNQYKPIQDILKDAKTSKVYIECSKNNYKYIFTIFPKSMDKITISFIEAFDKDTGEVVDNIQDIYNQEMSMQSIWKLSKNIL